MNKNCIFAQRLILVAALVWNIKEQSPKIPEAAVNSYDSKHWFNCKSVGGDWGSKNSLRC